MKNEEKYFLLKSGELKKIGLGWFFFFAMNLNETTNFVKKKKKPQIPIPLVNLLT